MPDEIDRLLDDALAAYTVTPERHGLEERVLARVNGSKRHRRYRLVCATAVAAAISGLLMVWPVRFAEKQVPVPKISEVVGIHPAPPTEQRPVLLSKATPSKGSSRRRLAEPKRPEFPTARPMTPQEHALAEMAHSQSSQLAILQRPMAPLEVPPIQIEMLEQRKN